MVLMLCALCFAPLRPGNSKHRHRETATSANPSKNAHCWRNNCQSESEASSASGFGAERDTFVLQLPPRCRMQLERVAGGSPAFPHVSPQQFFNFAFRFHAFFQLDGKTPGFSRAKIPRAISSSRSRHLLRRELTVFGFNFNVAA